MAEHSILDFLDKNLNKLDGGATYLNTYCTVPSGGLFTGQLTNRPSKSWPKAQFLYATVDNQGHPIDECISQWKLMCSTYNNQYLIIADLDGHEFLYDYDGKLLAVDDEIEFHVARIADFTIGDLADQPLQLIYYGAPGTGKSYTIDKMTNENNSVRTTFHPDSDYAGFVGAYKPTMENVPMSAFVGTNVHIAQPQGGHTGTERKIVYKYVPQAFLKAYVEAWKRYAAGEDNPYYLVIEEINRGNCAQIFGDLFQLLDRNNTGSSSYAISADEDIAQFLRDDEKGFASLSDDQKSAINGFVLKKDSGSEEQIGPSILDGSKLLLPPNLRIWATMNTSDQSLFPIDSAFKRRWNWEYMPIEYDKKDWTFLVGDKRYRWGDFLREINPKILKLTMSEDKQMGYFFAKPDKKSKEGLTENDTISTKVFVNKVLFYLWTDVFKDYDLTEEPFVYEDKEGKKVAYRFTDFFPVENNEKLYKFISGLGLDEVSIEEEPEDIEEELPEIERKKNPSSTFKIRMADGTVISSKRAMDALIEFVRYAGIDKVRALDIRSHKNSETAPEGIKFISKSTDEGFGNWNKRYKTPIIGTEYFINVAWSVDDMVKKLIKPVSDRLNLKIVSTDIIPQSEYDIDEAAD